MESLGSSAFEQTNFELLADFSRGISDDLMYMSLVYDAAVFAGELIGRLGRYYIRAFALMLDRLDEPHHARSLLGEEELRLLYEWNETAAEYPGTMCLHELFEAQVERTPDAVALTFGASTLTYRELNERANSSHTTCASRRQPRHARRALPGAVSGDGRGHPRRAEGRRRIPPARPRVPARAPRLHARGRRARVLLTQASLLDRLGESSGEVLGLDAEQRLARRHTRRRTSPRRRRAQAIEPRLRHLHLRLDGQAQGRDGRAPPGAPPARLHRRGLRLRPSDVWTLFHSYAFDFSVWEICGARSLYGGRLVLVPRS